MRTLVLTQEESDLWADKTSKGKFFRAEMRDGISKMMAQGMTVIYGHSGEFLDLVEADVGDFLPK